MSSIESALVIGAGVAGPATAMALAEVGITATVYEAREESAWQEGTFLTVASNGLGALAAVGADKAVLAAGFPTPSIVLRSGSGKRLGAVPTGLPPGEGEQSHTIKRADLHRALNDEAAARGIEILYGKRFVGASESATGVTASFADGSTAGADLLVGCDGVGSVIRRIVDPAAPAPTYAGLVGTGGYVEGLDLNLEPGACEMIFGRRAFFGYVGTPAGEVWWFANVPRREEPGAAELRAVGGDAWRERLVELYEDDAGPAVELIRATPRLEPMLPMHTIAKLPHWHSDRMVVLGDAAHAPSPSSGQGASLSIEDAIVLARALRDEDTPRAAMASFEAARRPRVEGIIKRAARTNSSKAAGPIGRRFRDLILPAIIARTANGKAHRGTFEFDAAGLLSGRTPLPG